MTPDPTGLGVTYPTARVRGRVNTRWEERSLRWAVLDAATAREMGREQLGWFVGGHAGLGRAAEQLGRLDANPEGGVWVVVPLSKEMSAELWLRWPHPHHVSTRPTEAAPQWQSRRVWVAPPESLSRILAAARGELAGVAGVIVLDPPCILHKARGGTNRWGRTIYNDRPQHVVNFRAGLDIRGWQPPLLILTEQPAKAVDPDLIARAFCLNGFQFLAGDSFGCWECPIEPEPPLAPTACKVEGADGVDGNTGQP